MTFLMTVVLFAVTSQYVFSPESFPSLPVSPVLAAAFWISIVVLLVAPLGLHLLSALQTLLLLVAVTDRAGISQTVQVLAYATAPCVVAGVPIPAIRAIACLHGAVLLIVGLRIVHETSIIRAILAGFIPAFLLFGYGFGGVAALEALGVAIS